jgi:hypothetical protein
MANFDLDKSLSPRKAPEIKPHEIKNSARIEKTIIAGMINLLSFLTGGNEFSDWLSGFVFSSLVLSVFALSGMSLVS